MKIELHNNECFNKLKELPDNSVDCIVTDPPYFISFMNKGWDKEDSIASKKEFWKECLRVTKEGGYLLAFGHSRTHHRLFTAIEDGGWEIRDTLMWLHGQGFPKGENLKPAHEPICMARKGKGNNNLNIDDCRIETNGENFDDVKGRPIHKLTNGGKQENLNNAAQQKALDKLKKLGRYPANVILDEEAGQILDKQSGITKSVKRSSKNNKDRTTGTNTFTPNKAIYTEENTYADSGVASRFFYCPKVSSKERGEGNTHPTVKPQALMEYLIKLVSKEEHTILDPFMGSGSTGIAAKKLNRSFVGIEMDEAYYVIAKERINAKT